MLNLVKKRFFQFLIIAGLIFLPLWALAGSGVDIIKGNLQETAAKADLQNQPTNLPVVLGAIINYLFGIFGVIFLLVTFIGAFFWMTAGGQEEKVKKGKETISWGINGILIIFFAYALVYVVLAALKQGVG